MNNTEARIYTNEKLRELRLIRRRDTLQVLGIPILATGGILAISTVLNIVGSENVKIISHLVSTAAIIAATSSIIKVNNDDTEVNREIKKLVKYKNALRRNKNPLEKVLIYRKTYR